MRAADRLLVTMFTLMWPLRSTLSLRVLSHVSAMRVCCSRAVWELKGWSRLGPCERSLADHCCC